MKIGIVGGTGNISQSIVRLLLEKGNKVVCFNRGQTTNVPGFVVSRVVLPFSYVCIMSPGGKSKKLITCASGIVPEDAS